MKKESAVENPHVLVSVKHKQFIRKIILTKTYNNMKTPKEIKLLLVGQLMEELSEYSQECLNWDIVCNDPDGTSYYVANIEGALEIDEDGDLRISLDDAEYDKDDCYTVEMLLDELKKYKLQTKVYLAGHGLYMTWDDSMTYDDEYEEIGFNGITFGKYEEQSNASGWLTESEKRNLAKEHKEEQLKKNLLRIVLAVMTILLISGAIY